MLQKLAIPQSALQASKFEGEDWQLLQKKKNWQPSEEDQQLILFEGHQAYFTFIKHRTAFTPFRFSTDSQVNHIVEGNFLSSVYQFKC